MSPASAIGFSAGNDSAPLFHSLPPSLPTVVRGSDFSGLLKPGPFQQRSDVLGLDFIESDVGGDTLGVSWLDKGQVQVRMAANVARRLTEELLDLPQLPRAVFVSPNADPFPPLGEIQHETARIVEVLGRMGVEAWLMTRGFIRPAVIEQLRRHANKVKVTMALSTLDRPLQRLLEPLTAPPRLRLKSINALCEAGISCTAALEPLIPSVTDTRENLMPVLEALATAGIRSVTVGYLVMHPRTEQRLESILRPSGLSTMVMEEYARASVLGTGRGGSGRYLPRARRQHGYAAVMAMAAGLGLRVSVNSLTNPDFTATHAPVRRAMPQAVRRNAG